MILLRAWPKLTAVVVIYGAFRWLVAPRRIRGRSKDMTKTNRTAIIALIDASTDFDAATIKFHRDGTISGIKNADKTFNGPETDRILIGHVSDFANSANPFRA